VFEVLYHYAKFGGARISPAGRASKNGELFVCPSVCYRQHCAQRNAPVFNTLRPILRFFAPKGRHVAPMELKFATEEETFLRAKIQPHRCNDKGVGLQKLTFLLRFDEYKRPAGAYPLRDFHKICRVCTPFLVGFWSWSYWGFKLRGSGYPQIFSAP